MEEAVQQYVDPDQPIAPETPVAADEATTQPQEQTTPESEAQTAKPDDKANPVQKRIDQLTWKAHEAERRANAAIMAQQEAENRAQQAMLQQQELIRRATMPNPAQFNMDPQAYQQAVDAHNQAYFAQAQRQMQEQAQRQQQVAQAQQFHQHVSTRIAEGMQKYADYQEVVSNPALPNLPQVNPPLFAAILQHPDMPEITYYLSKNPAEAHRIAGLPPYVAIAEIGKLSGRLPGNLATQASKAPAPPSTVGGNQRANNQPSDSDNVDDWLRKRNAQLKRR